MHSLGVFVLNYLRGVGPGWPCSSLMFVLFTFHITLGRLDLISGDMQVPPWDIHPRPKVPMTVSRITEDQIHDLFAHLYDRPPKNRAIPQVSGQSCEVMPGPGVGVTLAEAICGFQLRTSFEDSCGGR